MDTHEKGQVSRSAAEVYEEFFIPALFGEWAPRVADAAHIQPGQRVLDVACGTGILTRTVAQRVGTGGSVVGLDMNEGMLAVATRKAPQIEWRQGKAEALPFNADHFDAVVSQFGLMFFENRAVALQEMLRVLRPGGYLVIAVWDSLKNTPGYAAMVDLLQRLFGEHIAHGLRAPYLLGDQEKLRSLLAEAGLSKPVTITTHQGTVRFPSLESWIYTEIKGWVLADLLDDAQLELLRREAKQELSPYGLADGRIAFNAPAHIVSYVK
jgi:ubiquinone/menaquinone biosynthesis C-methylase UbiE